MARQQQQLQYENVNALLIDSDIGARDSLKALLANIGFRGVRVGADAGAFMRGVNDETLDLLICDTNLPGGDFCELAWQVRHHQIGRNPFLPIIAIAWEPTLEHVYRVIDTGADHLLCKPISTAMLFGHIQLLVKQRKPFMVTSDYVGPERKKGLIIAPESAPIDVPNTLRHKAEGTYDERNLQQILDAAINQVNRQKLARHSEHAVLLATEILACYRNNQVDAGLVRHLDRLIYLAEDTDRRMRVGNMAHVSDLCQSLLKVALSVRQSYMTPDPKDLQLLLPVCQAIERAFKAGGAEIDAARALASTVGRASR